MKEQEFAEQLCSNLRSVILDEIKTNSEIKDLIMSCAFDVIRQELKNAKPEDDDKIYYQVSDFLSFMKVDKETIRRNYIKKGKITGFKKGKIWLVEAKEYKRVKDIVVNQGIGYLGSAI